ncbi:hypothetical protein DTL70_26955 [Streptomyces diacarni]|uniref:Uncharacterized protein n=1 Tax=Streptomyces diacarni TaxID=2800381 RepID=A0A367EHY9_9ACTN|nr:hypothetical protein DTL70_26955 [Streptomyces diacarni]
MWSYLPAVPLLVTPAAQTMRSSGALQLPVVLRMTVPFSESQHAAPFAQGFGLPAMPFVCAV